MTGGPVVAAAIGTGLAVRGRSAPAPVTVPVVNPDDVPDREALGTAA
ncbi:hypothetical protein ACFWBB_14555 [Streptomyces sp. NPDC060000]